MSIVVRAAQTASLLRMHRLIGAAKKRRRLPRQIPARMVQVEYARAMFNTIELVEQSLTELFAQLPMLTETAAIERRLDAGEGKTVRDGINIARTRLRATVGPGWAEGLAEKFASRISDHQKTQLLRQAKAALGVDIFVPERGLAPLIDGFVSENVALIQSIPEQLFTDVEKTITRGFQRGLHVRDLTSEISSRFDLSRNRARLIARDQVGSLTGQLNKIRQSSLGISRYRWRTVGDDRVRDEHDSREGEIFEWSDPPDGGHPGEPIQCRCSAEPVFDEILEAAA